nr:hypothetical protein [Tanacetum cinerariifolium]
VEGVGAQALVKFIAFLIREAVPAPLRLGAQRQPFFVVRREGLQARNVGGFGRTQAKGEAVFHVVLLDGPPGAGVAQGQRGGGVVGVGYGYFAIGKLALHGAGAARHEQHGAAGATA